MLQMIELPPSCDRGPEIYSTHRNIIFDIDGTLLEIYPRALILAADKLFKEKSKNVKFNQSWEVFVFDQILKTAQESGAGDAVIELYKSGFWTDESIVSLLPTALGAKEFTEWNAANGKTQKAHSARSLSLLEVTKQSLSNTLPDISGVALRDPNAGVDEYLFKIENAEHEEAIFVDDKPDVAVAFAKYIDELLVLGKTPKSHLILVPYAQISVPEIVLDPKYSPFITVFKNLPLEAQKGQDLGRVLAFFKGRKGSHMDLQNVAQY